MKVAVFLQSIPDLHKQPEMATIADIFSTLSLIRSEIIQIQYLLPGDFFLLLHFG
jgi:hypothetical protein